MDAVDDGNVGLDGKLPFAASITKVWKAQKAW